MDCGIAIFVKTPAYSPVKTRLWPQFGRERSEALYRIAAEAVASVAEAARARAPIQPYWAVAEAEALGSDFWPGLPHLPQGAGSLGERMAQVYRLLRQDHHGAILIGADSPQMVPALLERAAQWLISPAPRLVIGRAQDGGFWLFGGNVALAQSAWMAPTYSSADTAERFVAAMRGEGDWLELETLHDLDNALDLPQIHTCLKGLGAPTAAQRRLLEWCEAFASTDGRCS